MGPDDQVAPFDEATCNSSLDLALPRLVEVREGQVAAEDQMEGPCGHPLREVLPTELDPLPEIVQDSESIPLAGKGPSPEILRQVLHTGCLVASHAGPTEHALVSIRGDDP